MSNDTAAWRRQALVTSVMALVFVAGFLNQFLMGRSSFDAPLVVHVHAVVFFGWVAINTVQACFALLTGAAIRLRHDTGWHRRLHLCALATLMGPAFGRILPMPLMIPWAMELAMLPGLAFPAWLAWRERREDGAVHPAWIVGLLALPLTMLVAWLLAHSPIGDALYQQVVAGRAGEAVPGLAFGAPPPGI